MSQFWLSFCDTDKPKGEQFLGVVILEAFGPVHAVAQAWDLDLNPGGEVQIVGPVPDGTWPDSICGRLLDREEAERW